MQPFLYAALSLTTLALLFLSFYLRRVRTKHSVEKKQQSEFMAVMIHELRSPLSVIKSSASMLQKEADVLSSEQKMEMLKQVEDSSSELLNIVSNLLDVAKIEAGKIELFKSSVNVNDLLDKEIEYYKNLSQQKGVELRLDLDHNLFDVDCDKEKVLHVMNNLLSNALKFTDRGGLVTVTTQGYKGYIQVTVSDTGRGISDDVKEKLFNKYTQAQEQSKEKGTGLGLVIVKGIIEAHGGRIWIEDNKPQGVKFIFTLPI